MTASPHKPDPPVPDKQTVHVTVSAPGETRTLEMSFDKHTSVGEAAKAAAEKFGFAPSEPTLAKGREVLDRTKQLVAAGVRDGDALELIDAGGGV